MLILNDLKEDLEKQEKEIKNKKEVLIIETIIENLKEVNDYYKNNNIDTLDDELRFENYKCDLSATKKEYERNLKIRVNLKQAYELRKMILKFIKEY